MIFPNIDPVVHIGPWALQFGPLALRWYALAYVAGILLGWRYAIRLTRTASVWGARTPTATALQIDDLVLWITLGIILGGRIGYVLFYAPEMFLSPLSVLRLWDGGMSFHGGVIGTSIGIILFARRHGLNWLRIHDYVACCVPFGLFFGRLANFVNGELWGKPTDVAWGIVFPRTGLDVPRHPSQLYEAGLEGIVLFAILWVLFWRTKTWRYAPGKLVGAFILFYGLFRFIVEFFREPDAQAWTQAVAATGLHMGQWLCLPMIAGGIYLIATAKGRRERVEPIAGSESVA